MLIQSLIALFLVQLSLQAELGKPYSYSITSLKKGAVSKTLWSTPIKKLNIYNNHHFNERFSSCFTDDGKHLVFDTPTGKVLQTQDILKKLDIYQFDSTKNQLIKERYLNIKSRRPNLNNTSLVIGKYHYFLAWQCKCAGRLNTENGKMEYLEPPTQMIPIKFSMAKDKLLWLNHYTGNQPSNAQGMLIDGKVHDKAGWGHISTDSPAFAEKLKYWT